MKPSAFFTLACLTLTAGVSLRAADPALTDEQTTFFERKIRPVLAQQCYECHSVQAKKIKGGLKLDTREDTLRGGENGPAVVPGKLDESLLIGAIRYADKDTQMPPKKQLPASVVADFEAWVKMGAPDPRSGGSVADAEQAKASWKKREINIEEGRKFWAFQPPKKSTPPAVKNAAWPKGDIDKYTLAKMEEKGLQPVADASKLELVRRLTFDLTGLPPTPDQIHAYVNNQSPNAYAELVDDLLASDRFGEYWGRHWLDVARYAESSGKDVNVFYPFAWRYRDWVIEAMNKDMPFDEFLKEQIAGDLLPFRDAADQSKKIIATGFLAIGTKPHNERNRAQFALEETDEQIDTMSQAMLGVTVACARCHDHKFDPISQKDYYALAGIFMSSDTLYGGGVGLQNAHPADLVDLGHDSGQPAGFPGITAAERARIVQQQAETKQTLTQLARDAREAYMNKDKTKANAVLQLQVQRQRMEQENNEITRYDEQGSPRILTMGVYDKKYPVNSPVYTRGDANQPGESVPRGMVQVMFPGTPQQITRGSGRKELAQWLGSQENPLTARVFVNRTWRWLFGRGIVGTTDNFGAMGERPTNPELLDALAVQFMQDGWSIKKLVRSIVLSHTYQLGAHQTKENFLADPDNTLFWRANTRRLEAEQLRDSILAVSGKLDLYPEEGSAVCRAGEGRQAIFALFSLASQPNYNRSVYLPIVRDQLPESLSLFDFPDPSLVSGDRDNTNVPSQGLYLLNNPFVQSLSDSFARRVYDSAKDNPTRAVNAYWLAFGRPPTEQEAQATRTFFLNYQMDADKARSQQKGHADLTIYTWSALLPGPAGECGV